MRKSVHALASLLTALAFSMIPLGPASAEQTYAGAVCQPFSNSANIGYGFATVFNDSTAQRSVICPTPIDHNIGNATWTIRVNDASSTQGFACSGVVFDANGTQLALTPNCTTTNAFTGSTTITCTATAGGYSTTFTHAVLCLVPPTSSITRITLN